MEYYLTEEELSSASYLTEEELSSASYLQQNRPEVAFSISKPYLRYGDVRELDRVNPLLCKLSSPLQVT